MAEDKTEKVWLERFKHMPTPLVNEEKKAQLLQQLKKAESSTLRNIRNKRRAVWSFAATAACFLFAQLLLTSPVKEFIGSPSNIEALIVDPYTEKKIKSVVKEDHMYEIDLKSDRMDRGKHDFSAFPLVVDPMYYQSQPIRRGDVVHFQKNGDKTVSRVVGLPGEKVKIEEGQVYIDGKKLDTFYGREFFTGLIVLHSQAFLKETKVPKNHYFMLADNWWRAGYDGVVAKSDILGKVLGYSNIGLDVEIGFGSDKNRFTTDTLTVDKAKSYFSYDIKLPNHIPFKNTEIEADALKNNEKERLRVFFRNEKGVEMFRLEINNALPTADELGGLFEEGQKLENGLDTWEDKTDRRLMWVDGELRYELRSMFTSVEYEKDSFRSEYFFSMEQLREVANSIE